MSNLSNIVRLGSAAYLLLGNKNNDKVELPTDDTDEIRKRLNAGTDAALDILNEEHKLLDSDYSNVLKAELHVYIAYKKTLFGYLLSSAYVLWLKNKSKYTVYLSGIYVEWSVRGMKSIWTPYTYSDIRINPNQTINVRLNGTNKLDIFPIETVLVENNKGNKPPYVEKNYNTIIPETLKQTGQQMGIANIWLRIDTGIGEYVIKTLSEIDTIVEYTGEEMYQGSNEIEAVDKDYKETFNLEGDYNPFIYQNRIIWSGKQ